MESMSNYVERGVLNTLKGTAFSAPSKKYLALFLSNPTETGTGGIEVNYEGYLRVELAEWTIPAVDTDATRIVIKNVTEARFASSPIALGDILYAAIFDSQERGSGNMLFYGMLEEALKIAEGGVPTISENMFKIYLKGSFSDVFKKEILGILNGNAISSKSPYLSIFNGDNEITSTSYSRAQVEFGNVTEASNGTAILKNSSIIEFPESTEAWTTGTKWVLMNGPSGNNMLLSATPSSLIYTSKLTKHVFDPENFSVEIN